MPMKHNTQNRLMLKVLTCTSLLLALAACGGGGNESGPADSLYLSFTQIKFGTTGNCAVGLGPEVHIYGGAPPYTLANSVPQGMVLSKSLVQNSGESFVINFVGRVCLSDVPITVEDSMGRLAQVRVSNGL